MTRYYVKAAMIAPAAFGDTVKSGAQVRAFYQGDQLFGCAQSDIDRLREGDFLEVVTDEEPAAA